MRQRRRRVRFVADARIGDAHAGGQGQRGRHQRGETMARAGAAAGVAATIVVRVARMACIARMAGIVRVVGRHLVMRDGIRVVRHRHHLGAVRLGHGLRRHRCMHHGRDIGPGLARMPAAPAHRRHRRTDPVRHEGEAEQGMQQKSGGAHAGSVPP